MRRAAYMVGVLMMIVGLLGLYACGSSDVLGEVGQRYVSNLTIEDAEDEDTLDIDVIQGMCEDEPELFTNTFGILTLTVAEDAAGVTLTSYSVEYTPLESADGSGGTVMPPELAWPGDGFSDFDVPSGGSAELRFTCLSTDTKEEYVNETPAALDVGRYRIRFIFHFENTAGEDIDITVDRTVYLANYDNC
jgi:hypothetical protein